MKIHIALTDPSGVVFEGDADLIPIGGARVRLRRSKSPGNVQTPSRVAPAKRLDFAMNERAFVKTHARGLSNPKKFVLLLAYMAKGDVAKEVELRQLEKNWNKMTSDPLLGCKFNRFYSNTAKDNGWVNTPRKGIYTLSASWKEAMQENNG